MQESEQKIENKQRLLQLGSFLTAFGNHEAKSLLILAMNQKEKYFLRDLIETMRQIQGDHPAWRFNRGVLIGYCDVTLSPHKLIDVICTSEGSYYRKTDYAALAEPLAGHLLAFSERLTLSKGYEKTSLLAIFGSSNSTVGLGFLKTPQGPVQVKKTSPLLRYKIYTHLLKTQLPTQEITLSKELHENFSVLGNHLRTLAKHNILHYEARQLGKPISLYHAAVDPPSTPPEPFRYHRAYTQEVYDILMAHPNDVFSVEQVTDLLIKNNPEREHLDWVALAGAASRILSYLKNHSNGAYAQTVKLSHDIQSEVNLLPAQRTILQELIALLDKFQSRDRLFIEEGRKKAKEIIEDPYRVKRLLIKAYMASPNTKSM